VQALKMKALKAWYLLTTLGVFRINVYWIWAKSCFSEYSFAYYIIYPKLFSFWWWKFRFLRPLL